jgi:hypothetical protein
LPWFVGDALICGTSRRPVCEYEQRVVKQGLIMRRLAAGIAVALILSSCSSAAAPATTTTSDGLVRLDGFLVQAADGPLMICTILLDSMPPQCGEGTPVVGVDISTVPGATFASGVSWTEDPVTLEGTLSEGVLIVSGGTPTTSTTSTTAAP